MKIKIKEWCLKVASLGNIGHLPFGAQVAALAAFPVLVILGWLLAVSPFIFYLTVGLIVSVVLVAVYGALLCECDHHPGIIVLNNFLGILVACMFIPLTIKFAAIGFLLFYLVKFTVPLVIKAVFKIELERWPIFLQLIGIDFVAGLLVNIFLQFVWWMAH